ncbi:MAG TPA: peptidoglycan DD-metalloendopeptidase family protein [Thermomicrobiales bacterium]|nr:peptidoglycan DD-metalloendopeptidase family protein [Thermomicrobiales bacterium]
MIAQRARAVGLICVLLAATALPPLFAAGVVAAAATPAAPLALAATPPSAVAGAIVTFRGGGFAPGEPVALTTTPPAGQTYPLNLIPRAAQADRRPDAPPAVTVDTRLPPAVLPAGPDGVLAFEFQTVANYQTGAWAVDARGQRSGRAGHGAFTLSAPPTAVPAPATPPATATTGAPPTASPTAPTAPATTPAAPSPSPAPGTPARPGPPAAGYPAPASPTPATPTPPPSPPPSPTAPPPTATPTPTPAPSPSPTPVDHGPGVPLPPPGPAVAPAQLLGYFDAAARRTGVPAGVLLAIARVESGFDSRAIGPFLPQFAGTEDEHALGLMQFLPGSYRPYAAAVDGITGKNLGMNGIWDAESAIYAAAFYLRDSGAPGDLRGALFAYNHADWYVDLVLAWAAYYAGGVTADPNLFSYDGHGRPPAGWHPGGALAAPENPLLPAATGRHLDVLSPITLYAPWTAGETWHAGGDGSFYGQGLHSDADAAFYAVDLNKGPADHPADDADAPVLAAADGVIHNIYQDGAGAWVVEIYHLAPDGAQLRTLYVHLQDDPRVHPGIQVNQPVLHGTVIGFVGGTGEATGPHLHFGLWLLQHGEWVSIRPEPLDGQFLTAGGSLTSTNTPPPAGAPILTGHGFSPGAPSNAALVTIAASGRGGAAPLAAIGVYVNAAPDGSDRGQWLALGTIQGDHGTVAWPAAPVADGTYRVLFDLVDQAGHHTYQGLTDGTAVTYTVHRGNFRGALTLAPRPDLTFLAPLDGTLLARLGPRAPVVSGPLRFSPPSGPTAGPLGGAQGAAASAAAAAATAGGNGGGPLAGAPGLFVEEGTTNLAANPSFEQDTGGWAVRDEPGGALAVTLTDGGRFGRRAVLLDNRRGTGPAIFFTAAGDGGPTAWSVYARTPDGAPGAVQLAMSGVAPRAFDLTGEWRRLVLVGATGAAGTARQVVVPAGAAVALDGAQIEAKPYATSYVDGSLGPGYGWDRAPGASLSGRLPTTLTVPLDGVLTAARGSLGFWATPQEETADGAQLLDLDKRLTLTIAGGQATLRWGDAVVGAAPWQPGVTHRYDLTWEHGALTFYQDGQVAGRAQVPDFAIPPGSSLAVGSDPRGTHAANAVIQDLAAWDRALDAGEVAALAGARAYVRPGRAVAAGPAVTLALAVQGAAPVRVAFSFDGQTWTAPRPFAPLTTLALPADVGPRRVYVRYTGPDGRAVVAADTVVVTAPPQLPLVARGAR